MKTSDEFITQAAYAKRRGVSHVAVGKAVKDGRLKKSLKKDGTKILVNPRIADEEWAANTDASKRHVEPKVASAEEGASTAASVLVSSTAGTAVPVVDEVGELTLAEARAMKERYSALLQQLDYGLKSGKLIEADEARKLAFQASRRARDKLLTIPDRLAPVVAGLTEQFECHQAIIKEINVVLAELSTHPLGE